MIDSWIAEATECDFKVALEIKKPKSWLKASAHLQTVLVAHYFSVLMITEM